MISADQIAKAVVASAHHYGVDPIEAMSGAASQARVRLTAALGIAKSGALPNRAAARLCGVKNANALSPSMWPKNGVTQVAIDIVIDVLGGAPLPSKPLAVKASARPKAVKPKDTGPGYEPAALSIDVVARRQRDRMNEAGFSLPRTDQDRKPIKGTVTAKLMGDPVADRLAASEEARRRVARQEARYAVGAAQ